MSVATQAFIPPGLSVDTMPPTKQTLYNLSIAAANTEYSQALPANTKAILIRSRSRGNLQITTVSGESGTKYLTVLGGAVFSKDNINFSGTIYLRSSKAGDTVEIETWS